MEEHIYVDATDMTTFFVHDAYYCGTLKVYSKNRPIVTNIFEPERSGNDPQQTIWDVLHGWDLAEDDDEPYDYDTITDNFFTRITVNENMIISIEGLDWQEAACACRCGDKVTHKTSPIPPGYGEVSNQNTEVL